MSKPKPTKRRKDDSRVVLVRDLAPRRDVKGGSGKLLFGERLTIAEEPAAPAPIPIPYPTTGGTSP
jgi:hypothetical protein